MLIIAQEKNDLISVMMWITSWIQECFERFFIITRWGKWAAWRRPVLSELSLSCTSASSHSLPNVFHLCLTPFHFHICFKPSSISVVCQNFLHTRVKCFLMFPLLLHSVVLSDWLLLRSVFLRMHTVPLYFPSESHPASIWLVRERLPLNATRLLMLNFDISSISLSTSVEITPPPSIPSTAHRQEDHEIRHIHPSVCLYEAACVWQSLVITYSLSHWFRLTWSY